MDATIDLEDWNNLIIQRETNKTKRIDSGVLERLETKNFNVHIKPPPIHGITALLKWKVCYDRDWFYELIVSVIVPEPKISKESIKEFPVLH